jgi:hypothetical protein
MVSRQNMTVLRFEKGSELHLELSGTCDNRSQAACEVPCLRVDLGEIKDGCAHQIVI